MESEDVAQTFVPWSKDGCSNISEHLNYHAPILDKAESIIMNSLANVIPDINRPFVIGDYGTADGNITYNTIHKIIGYIRDRYGERLPIQVLYEDLPLNDFKHVVSLANGLVSYKPGLRQTFKNVFPAAIGVSFYEQCMPANSMDFILCSFAQHWLSKCPGKLRTSVFTELAGTPECQAYKDHAARDWEQFLLHRATELKPGGCLVVINISDVVKDQLRVLDDVWKSLVVERVITEEEFLNTNFAYYLKSEAQTRQPLEDASSPVRRSGLKLISLDRHSLSSNLLDQASGTLTKEIIRSAAELLAKEKRSWGEYTFHSALDAKRPEGEKEKIVNMLYDRFAAFMVEHPDQFTQTISSLCSVFVKENSG